MPASGVSFALTCLLQRLVGQRHCNKVFPWGKNEAESTRTKCLDHGVDKDGTLRPPGCAVVMPRSMPSHDAAVVFISSASKPEI
jgi:hypothetical protein